MNEIQIFKSEKFGQIRTLMINNEPWFVGNDVAKALGYGEGKSLPNAISNHVDMEDKGVTKMMTPGGNQEVTIINESGLYSLILSSKLPSAKEFKRWVTSEVLPSIRKTGSYSLTTPSYQILDPIKRAEQWIEEEKQRQKLAAENASQQKQLEEQKPKVEFFDAVAESKTAIEMKEVANVLNFQKVGRNTLFQILRDNKLLTHKNQPYQRYVDCGFFRTIEQEWQRPNGDTNINIKTLVYQSGVDYIRKLLLKLGYKPNPKEHNNKNEHGL